MEHDKQANHLKAYGITYWVINQGIEAYWMLNYRGGSFAFPYAKALNLNVKFEVFMKSSAMQLGFKSGQKSVILRVNQVHR